MIGAIAAAISSGVGPAVAKATGGNEIKQVGSYWYHIFTSSGTFTPLESLTLAVTGCGGGGGGAANVGGAGGGGELDINTSVSATATAYTVTVGALGAGQTGNTGFGAQGGTTTFDKTSPATNYVTSLGGGYGADTGANGGTGGSGGGGGAGIGGGAASGSNTFAGGAGNGGVNASGGGGGATAVGAVGTFPGGTTAVGGAGGLGYALSTIDANLTAANFTSFTGMTVICSGGGGAGLHTTATRGLGGTGAGNGGQDTYTPSVLQFAATSASSFGAGGGAGGWSNGAANTGNKPAGSGYGGVVIVRYPV